MDEYGIPTEQNNSDATATPEVTLETLQVELEKTQKRFRDTQAAYTKGQQELARMKAEKETTPLIIDAKTQEELDTLKFEDPDAWKARLDKLDQEHKQKNKEILSKAEMASEMAKREVLLSDFNANRETPITFDTIKKDVPFRITEKLSNGEVTFEEYLVEVDNYLSIPKVVAGSKPGEKEPDFNGAGGSSEVRASAAEQEKSYENDVY